MSTPQHGPSDATWQEFLTRLAGATPIDGTVVSVVPFGAFVRLPGEVDGLLHMSEWASEPAVGETVRVRVQALDLQRHRVSLVPA